MCANINHMPYVDEFGRALSDYPRPSVAVDVAVLTYAGSQLCVVVVDVADRKPALPGTFLHENETLRDAAARALKEKAGIEGLEFTQLRMFDAAGRDERGWVLSMAHCAFVGRTILPTDVQLCPVSGRKPFRALAFDHTDMVGFAVDELRRRCTNAPDPARFLGATFSMLELRRLYEAIYDRDLSKDTFRRNMLRAVEPTGRLGDSLVGRPAELFRRRRGGKRADRLAPL